MITLDIDGVRFLVDATVTAVSILGGLMACTSGYAARKSVLEQVPSALLSHRINEGLASGFEWGVPSAVMVFIMVI